MITAKCIRNKIGNWEDDSTYLQIGKEYEVDYIAMGQSHTNVHLKDKLLNQINGKLASCFNSVYFEFYENGKSLDIFSDARFNPYLSQEEKSIMDKQELLTKINNCKSEIENLNARITDLQEQVEKFKQEINKAELEDILDDYKEALSKNSFWLEGHLGDAILGGETHMFCLKYDNPYACYPTQEYAEKARKIKTLNDMILAFKWCYDKDFDPDLYDEVKRCYIYYDPCNSKFEIDTGYTSNYFNAVCFSTHSIAEKCCDWLNSMDLEDLR